MLLPYRGKTIIENVLESVKESQLIDYIVVLGAYRGEILKATAHLNINSCFNDNYKEGMLSSVKRGLEYVPDNYCAAMIILGDQPMLTSQVLDSIARRYFDTGRKIIIPVYKGIRGHPVLIDLVLRKEIEQAGKNVGLNEIIALHSVDIEELEIHESAILRDIDTPEDYLRELNLT